MDKIENTANNVQKGKKLIWKSYDLLRMSIKVYSSTWLSSRSKMLMIYYLFKICNLVTVADKNTIPDICTNSKKWIYCMVRSRTLKKKKLPTEEDIAL